MRWGIYKGHLRKPLAVNLQANRDAAMMLRTCGVDYHHKLPGVESEAVSSEDLTTALEMFAATGITVGLHPSLSGAGGWNPAEAEMELARFPPVLRDPFGADLYLGHEVWRYLNRAQRDQLIGLARKHHPRLKPRFYYGHVSKIWTMTDFGRDAPHVVHLSLNHGAAEDVTGYYAHPQALVAVAQTARNNVELTTFPGTQLYLHFNVRPDDAADEIAVVLRAVSRINPDALIVRSCSADGAGVDCGRNVLDAIHAAREGAGAKTEG